MSYATKTSVPVARSQQEIRNVLSKYKASAFAFAENSSVAQVQFEISGRRIKIILPLPEYMKAKNHKGVFYGQKQIDQMIRSKWRALVLAIKAKLECVEAGITTLEQEFMAHIILPNGETVGDLILPEIADSYERKKMPSLLGFRK